MGRPKGQLPAVGEMGTKNEESGQPDFNLLSWPQVLIPAKEIPDESTYRNCRCVVCAGCGYAQGAKACEELKQKCRKLDAKA